MSLKFPTSSRVREVTEAEKEKGEEKEGGPRRGRGMKGSSSVAHPRCLSRIPDPIFSFPDPGSRVDKISDPGSGPDPQSKNLSIFNSQNLHLYLYQVLKYKIQDVHPG